jgi:L,D-peptidoglycan transpeptidase YkuD (ErfK/YbiS/YcfS/YnhG family)
MGIWPIFTDQIQEFDDQIQAGNIGAKGTTKTEAEKITGSPMGLMQLQGFIQILNQFAHFLLAF